jgi:hypothetical protein
LYHPLIADASGPFAIHAYEGCHDGQLAVAGYADGLKQQRHHRLTLEPAGTLNPRNTSADDTSFRNHHPVRKMNRLRDYGLERISFAIGFCAELIVELQADSCAFRQDQIGGSRICRRKGESE